MKNEFLNVIRSENSLDGRKRLADWLIDVENTNMIEFNNCTKAYRNRFQEILNFRYSPFTNGYTEGCNNKIFVSTPAIDIEPIKYAKQAVRTAACFAINSEIIEYKRVFSHGLPSPNGLK
jgi:hypothetical protein